MLKNSEPSSFQWVVMATMCFQGARISVTTQMKKNVVLVLMKIHNFGH
jgi:hypothetical protein